MDGADVVFVAAPVGALPAVLVEALGAAGPRAWSPTSARRSGRSSTRSGSAVRRRPSARRRGDGRGRPRARRSVRGRHLVPDADPGDRGLLYERLHRLLRELGARPAALDADTHDRLLATVSPPAAHPRQRAGRPGARALDAEGERLPATGPSFRDATRVAGANTAIWSDIYLSNARRAGRRDRRRRRAAGRGARRAGGRATASRRRLERRGARGPPAAAGGRPGRRRGARAARRRCRTARASSPRSRSRSGAPASTSRHGALSRTRRLDGRHRALDRRRRARRARPSALLGAWGSGGPRVKRSLRPRRPAARHARAAGRQVDLPPGGAAGGDDRRARQVRNYLTPTTRARRSPRCRRSAPASRTRAGGARRCAARDCERRAARRADRRRQRRHAHAAAAGLARRPAGRDVDARRRRVDPPPAGRPRRASRCGRWARGSRRARAASRRSRSRAPSCAGSSTRCPSRARRSSPACCSPACSPRAHHRGRAGAEPRSHRADAPAAGVGVDREATGSRRRPAGRARARVRPRAGRPVLGGVPDRGGDPRAGLAHRAWPAWARTGRGWASCASWSGWRHVVGARAGRRTVRPRSRSPSSTSPTGPLPAPGRARRGAAGDRRAAARGAARLLRGGRDGRAGRAGAALKESDRIATVVDGLRGLGARHRGDRGRLRGRGQRRLRGGADRRPRRPPARDARGGRRPRVARGGRGGRDGGGRRVYPGFEADLGALVG